MQYRRQSDGTILTMRTSLSRRKVNHILKKGRRYSHRGFTIIYEEKKELGDKKTRKRYSILIGKKIAQKSVKRNRIKRIIREVVRETQIKHDEFVILCTQKNKTESEIKKNLISALKKNNTEKDKNKRLEKIS